MSIRCPLWKLRFLGNVLRRGKQLITPRTKEKLLSSKGDAAARLRRAGRSVKFPRGRPLYGMKSAWQALDIWPRTPETRPRAPETRPRAPETYSQRTCSCALCRKYANASVRLKFLRKRITMDPIVTTQDRKSQRKTITLQKVRKRQCQMEVSAEKGHHGSHCDHPGPQKPTENDNFAESTQTPVSDGSFCGKGSPWIPL